MAKDKGNGQNNWHIIYVWPSKWLRSRGKGDGGWLGLSHILFQLASWCNQRVGGRKVIFWFYLVGIMVVFGCMIKVWYLWLKMILHHHEKCRQWQNNYLLKWWEIMEGSRLIKNIFSIKWHSGEYCLIRDHRIGACNVLAWVKWMGIAESPVYLVDISKVVREWQSSSSEPLEFI